MIENIKVRFARKPYDLADVLASLRYGDLANYIEIESRHAMGGIPCLGSSENGDNIKLNFVSPQRSA